MPDYVGRSRWFNVEHLHAGSWEPAAVVDPVEPIHITREEWERIKHIIEELCDIHDQLYPHHSIQQALIAGSAIGSLLEDANEVKHLIKK